MKKLIERIRNFFMWMRYGIAYDYDVTEISWHAYYTQKEQEIEGYVKSIATYYDIMHKNKDMMNEYWRKMDRPELIKD